MKIYIAGRISGYDGYRDKFDAAEQYLKELGYIVCNPVCLPDNLDYEDYFPICFAMIDICEAIYMLSSWDGSEGAKRELDYAISKRKTIFFEGGDNR